MEKVNFDGKEYDLASLSEEAKAQLNMLIATDTKIVELQRDIAIAQTARNAYFRAAAELMPSFGGGDTIKLN